MITNNEQRFDEMRRRILGGYGVNFEADDTPAPLDTLTVVRTLDEPRLIEEPPKRDRKAHWRNYAINPAKPKAALRQENPKTEIVKTCPSWWVGLSREEMASEIAKRQRAMSASPEARKVSANTFGGQTMPGEGA